MKLAAIYSSMPTRYITLHGNQTSAYTKSPADSSLHRLLAIQNTGSWVADWPPAAGFGKMMCLQMEPNTVYYIHSVKYTEHIKMIKSTNSNPLYDGRKMPILFLFWSLFFVPKIDFFRIGLLNSKTPPPKKKKKKKRRRRKKDFLAMASHLFNPSRT